MPRIDLQLHLLKIDTLVTEINDLVPPQDYRSIEFRADLAGLLVVAMAATYESCVKEIMFDFANRHHVIFGNFTQRNYEKLNSRVKINDLRNYCGLFDPSLKKQFNKTLSERKSRIANRIGKDIEKSYEQILDWRHDFAHAGVRATTIEEAAATHKLGKRVLYVFDEVFNLP